MEVMMSQTYYVTLEVPVQVTCSVTAQTIEDAMAAAREQIGSDGVESYHMSYDVEDQAKVTRVEEV